MRTPSRRWLRLHPSALLLLTLSVSSLFLYGKRPTFNQTIDSIILKISGIPLSSSVQCDKVQVCGGIVNTSWQSWIEKSAVPCSIDVFQSIDLSKTQNAICVWTGDVIAGRTWNHVGYRREYRFRLNLRNVARDGIIVEQVRPEDSHCVFVRPQLLKSAGVLDTTYAVHLTFTKRVNVSFRNTATGFGDGEQASTDQKGTDNWNEDSFPAGSEEIAQRVAQAFQRAVKLCGAKEEVF